MGKSSVSMFGCICDFVDVDLDANGMFLLFFDCEFTGEKSCNKSVMTLPSRLLSRNIMLWGKIARFWNWDNLGIQHYLFFSKYIAFFQIFQNSFDFFKIFDLTLLKMLL